MGFITGLNPAKDYDRGEPLIYQEHKAHYSNIKGAFLCL